MCGILGIVRSAALASQSVCADLMTGLGRLEYRGYDSAGVAFVKDRSIVCRKRAGKLHHLKKMIANDPADGSVGIAHIRWATHGQVTDANAHPHTDGRVAVVHNGIIENHEELRSELKGLGITFQSDTDTEVVLHLIAHYRDTGLDPVAAFRRAVSRLKGAFALAVIDHQNDDLLMGARRGAPLVVGHGRDAFYVGSDGTALSHLTGDITFLEDGDQVVLTSRTLDIFDETGAVVHRPVRHVDTPAADWDKGAYDHFMVKEIFEQPQVIRQSLAAYFGDGGQTTLPLDGLDFQKISAVTIVACGTAYYAGMTAQYWLENLTQVPVHVEIASEFRYRAPVLPDGSLVLFISQSGETADTLAAHRMVADRGYPTIGIVNVPSSSLAREAGYVIPTHAGVEIGVASTKALTAQLMALLAFGIHMGRLKGAIDPHVDGQVMADLSTLADGVVAAFGCEDAVKDFARRFTHHPSALYIGRGISYPLALEGALKLKELTYIHAEGYAAGELKHGPIALVDPQMPTVAIAPSDRFFDKTISNVHEILARRGSVLVLTDRSGKSFTHPDVATLIMADTTSITAPFIYLIPIQFFAYYVAVFKGTDVDQPRNLAKSVTVE